MAGADHPAGTSSSTDARPAAERTHSTAVLTGREAIAAVEQLLCGDGAVRAGAVAEGMALGGRAAATLLPDPGDVAGPVRPETEAPWVCHTPASRVPHGFAVELAASSAQHAVDHAMVARRAAVTLDRPVVCVMADDAIDVIDRVILPDRDIVAALTHDDRPSELHDAAADESAAAAVRDAFRWVAARTGRAIAPVESDGIRGADHVVVCAGTLQREATAVIRAMRRDGKRCGSVVLNVVQPFPADALREAVGETRSVIVVRPSDPAPRRGGAFLAKVRSSLRERPEVEVETTDAIPGPGPSDAATGPRVDARPAGPWAEGFVRAASAVAPNARLRSVSSETPADILFVGHPALLAPGPRAFEVRDGGAVVVVAPEGGPGSWWSRWPQSTRRRLSDRNVTLRWLNLATVEGLDLADSDAVRDAMLGALLAATPGTGGADAPVDALSGTVKHGAAALVPVDPAILETEGAIVPGVPGTPDLPREVSAPVGEPDPRWVVATRTFHLTGEGARSATEPSPATPLDPLAVMALDGAEATWRSYPLLVPDEPAADAPVATALHGLLRDAVDALANSGQDVTILSKHLPLLTRAAAASLEHADRPHSRAELLETAFVRFREGFDLSEAGAESLVEEIRRLEGRLGERMDETAEVVGLGPDTLPRLYAAAIRAERRPRRTEFLAEVSGLIERLEDILRVDDSHSPESASAGSLSAALGSIGDALMDPGELSSRMPSRHGSVRLSPERRIRLEHTVGRLRHHLADEARVPDLVVIQPGPMFDDDNVPRVRVVTHPDAALAAIGLFDAAAAQAADMLRAVRVARLEVDGAYDRERHDDALSRFDWRSMTEDELRMLPPVVVLETDARLRGRALGSLSELLRSGRPVHVLATHSTVEFRSASSRDRLARFHPGLGYLFVAHREAFVLQSSLGTPEHLADGLSRIARTLRPAVALVAVPAWLAPAPARLQLAAAMEGRAAPGFVYDPDAGAHWADRFKLDVNPQHDRVWPHHAIEVLGPAGEPASRDEVFTFAHAVALDPAYREHFRIVPPEAWTPEQVELAEYLRAPWGIAARKIPFIRVVIADGTIARALLTRELAFACLDRMRAWKILQELAGTDNEYARRAAAAARAEAEAAAGQARAELEAAHIDDLDRVGAGAAGEAMDRLVGVLMNIDGVPAAVAAPAMVPSSPAEVAPVEPEPAEPEITAARDDDDDDAGFTDPYIDTEMCTSCNDCTTINARLFKYDGNKQAYIDDPKVGTFDELVRAAEKCPARCIHPGVPRSDDTTANDDLIARAVKYN